MIVLSASFVYALKYLSRGEGWIFDCNQFRFQLIKRSLVRSLVQSGARPFRNHPLESAIRQKVLDLNEQSKLITRVCCRAQALELQWW